MNKCKIPGYNFIDSLSLAVSEWEPENQEDENFDIPLIIEI